jgi:hypothetical protein
LRSRVTELDAIEPPSCNDDGDRECRSDVEPKRVEERRDEADAGRSSFGEPGRELQLAPTGSYADVP